MKPAAVLAEPAPPRPATGPAPRRDQVRLLAIDRLTGAMSDHPADALPGLLAPGDLLVVNDAATLPASLPARYGAAPLELRLAGPTGDERRWRAVLFGPGDWRTATELRPPPPVLPLGGRLAIGPALAAELVAISPRSPRLVELVFDRGGAALWQALYAAGQPVQYSYLAEPLALWSVQSVFAGRPWAVEMPSAGRPLSWATLAALRRRGVELAAVTHAAGLSSTGDAALDGLLPLAERYDVPAATVAAVERTRSRGGRVVAVGTTVVRALESAARRAPAGRLLVAGEGEAELLLDERSALAAVDGVVTGVHGPAESHGRLLAAFVGREVVAAAFRRAGQLGYRSHELGDLFLAL
jgi:S-adenosylmethionine:tRNA ribosyltransferase-isomerase